MSNILAMIAAVDFVEAHLKDEITVGDIADSVSYSLFHFCRTFNQVVQHTPYDYLIRRRLSASALELLQSDKKIIDIAFDYRFGNPETYSRAFKRMFSIQPQQFRRQGSIDHIFLLPRLTPEHLQHLQQDGNLKPVMRELPPLRLLGWMSLVKEDKQIIPNLWHLLLNEFTEGSQKLDGHYYGIHYYPPGWTERGWLYFAGIDQSRWGALSIPGVGTDGLVTKSLPSLACAYVSHRGGYKTLGLTTDYILHTWLPKFYAGKSANSGFIPITIIERFTGPPPDIHRAGSEFEVFTPLPRDEMS